MATKRQSREQPQEKPRRGRPPMPPGAAKTAFVTLRLTEEQREEYDRRGGGQWIVKLLDRGISKAQR